MTAGAWGQCGLACKGSPDPAATPVACRRFVKPPDIFHGTVSYLCTRTSSNGTAIFDVEVDGKAPDRFIDIEAIARAGDVGVRMDRELPYSMVQRVTRWAWPATRVTTPMRHQVANVIPQRRRLHNRPVSVIELLYSLQRAGDCRLVFPGIITVT